MMKTILNVCGFFFMAAIAVTMVGCTSLENKAVVLDSSVQGFKVTTGADTTSGTPLPNISAGWGSNLLITMPTDKKGTMEYETESGSLFGQIFGIEVKDKTKVRITAGESKITVTSRTDEKKEVTTEVGNGTVMVNVTEGTVLSTPVAVSGKNSESVAAVAPKELTARANTTGASNAAGGGENAPDGDVAK